MLYRMMVGLSVLLWLASFTVAVWLLLGVADLVMVQRRRRR